MPLQADKKNKHRAGKKEKVKRQHRQERQALQSKMASDNISQLQSCVFELRRAGTKGFGLFATQDIKPGERIFQEEPLFMVPGTDITNESVISSFVSLLPDEQAAFLGLCSHITCSKEQKSSDSETFKAEDGANNPTDLEDPETPTYENGTSIKRDDHHHYAFEMQPLPPKGLDSSPDMNSSCKLPNQATNSDDQSLNKQPKLEHEAKASETPVQDPSRVESLDRDSDDKAIIWNCGDMAGALQAASTDLEAGGMIESTISISDDTQLDQRNDGSEITETLAARVIDIWRTNSYMLDDGVSIDYAGIGLTAARLNHSCTPNVYVAFNSISGFITVQAIQPIAAGDELCTAYILGPGKLRAERRQELRKWGFTCTCVACDGEGDEPQRREIKELSAKADEVKHKMLQDVESLTPEQIASTVEDLLQLASLMAEEDLLGPDLADVYFGAAQCCALLGHIEEATAIEMNRVGIMLRCYGPDSPACSAFFGAGSADDTTAT